MDSAAERREPLLRSPGSQKDISSPARMVRDTLESLPRMLFSSPSSRSVKPMLSVYSWGWGLNGQLGFSMETAAGFAGQGGNVSNPTKVQRLSVENVVQVCCGSRCTFVVTDRGNVLSFGRGDDGQLGHDELSSGNSATPRVIERFITHKITHVSCRNSHAVAISADREVWAWGRGDDGQLGLGTTESALIPNRVIGLQGIAIIDAAAGRQHTVLLSDAGEVYTMGSSQEGQLGLGDANHVLVPTKVVCEGMVDVVSINCGSRHSMALTRSGEVYAWGWNTFGQLGTGTVNNEFSPVRVKLPFAATAIACGFRHSFALSPSGEWWGWGWNQYGQLGHGEHHGINFSCSSPHLCSHLSPLGADLVLVPGGRHTLAITAEGGLYSFGRGSDGQLGHGDVQDRYNPTLVSALSGREITIAACGWAHSIAVAKADQEGVVVASPKSVVTRGDFDAFFGVFFNVLINLLLISSLCTGLVGMSADFVAKRILPGVGYSLFLGSSFFGLQCRMLARESGGTPTAQPFGLDTPILLSTVFLIMGPKFADSGDHEAAYKLGLFSCAFIGCLQIIGGFVGDWIRNNVPRAALLSALAGIGLGFIAEGFLFQIFADPVIAVVPMVLIWVAYASGITLPFGIPGAIAAVFSGTAIGFVCWGAGYNFWKPFQHHVPTEPRPGHFAFTEIGDAIGSKDAWSQLPLIVPLCVINIVGSLVNLEGAASVGDSYSTRMSMIATGSFSVLGAILGSPFPCCIFMGHSAWKAVGARDSYAFMCGTAEVLFCLFNGVTALIQIMPMDSTVSILLWVGLAVTATAFEGVPHQKTYHLAVAVGVLPAIASWAQQLVGNYLSLAGTSFYEIQHVEKNSLFMKGMISFSQGFLLLSVLLASLMVYICDRMFHKAAIVALLLSACSFFGFVHAYELHPTQIKPVLKANAAPHEATAYLIAFGVLAGLHLGGFSGDDSSTFTEIAQRAVNKSKLWFTPQNKQDKDGRSRLASANDL